VCFTLVDVRGVITACPEQNRNDGTKSLRTTALDFLASNRLNVHGSSTI